MGKLSTPDWILKGKEKPKEKKSKEKTFNLRRCPKCSSDNVNVLLTGEEGKSAREWECKKCKWHGKDVKEEELTEDEFMKYLDESGVDVA